MKVVFAWGFCACVFLALSSAAIEAQVRAAIQPQRLGPTSAAAQTRALRPAAVPSAGALGGSYASAGISRPLGGIAPPSFPSTGGVRHRKGSSGAYRYRGPVYYVPNAYDAFYDPGSSSPAELDPAAVPPRQPVIINQYFGSREPAARYEENASAGADTSKTVNPGDPLESPQNYYLIAYKDHTIYSALAYWVEGDTLHYVTTQNTHNQASLALIDLDQTAKLNADRSIPFSIAGK
jgi:hypothetical protein